MCGRFGYTNTDKEKIKKRFSLKKVSVKLAPRYNITPGQDVAVILNQAPEELSLVRWGLVPSWAKDEKIGYKMINARSETIFEKPSFRSPIRKKRCLILVDHFFEWKKTKEGKRPFCMTLKSKESFTFAGIWDSWRDDLKTCSIITTTPNSLLKEVHDRMPVILPKKREQDWLSDLPQEKIRDLLRPLNASDLLAHEVSTLVNSPENENSQIIAPI